MNNIRQIQKLNKHELDNGVSSDASWHADYRDTAYIYIGGLPFELSEGDIITMFSQFGEPTYVNLIRDKETGKSKGFAFLKYEDQRSTDLAVDNLGGATIMNRIIRVDHTRYNEKERENEVEYDQGQKPSRDAAGTIVGRERARVPNRDGAGDLDRPTLREEQELAILVRDHDDDDPMKSFLIQEKRVEVSVASAKLKEREAQKLRKTNHRHYHQQSHRSGSSSETKDARRQPHRRQGDGTHRRRSSSRS